ncbi:two-component system response regulator PgtA [Providencia alcalifaciens]|uniref:two-component system response regulator PgtA n=1 Tax=Providencia alcalifaciens TaxID=126385 RepID=UPI0003E2475E|nr:sigma-54 dependent transcriptional regulator [Providencia alcalifaciens]ETT02052.1 response regulator receiver domain protein [Providencia alcalifaciens PAL-3]EUC99484.1 response regulator receiver domain protein [Providencia alcalifaciens PAL-1]
MLDDSHDILLIDDDKDVLEAYCLLLEQAGYRVYACDNPLTAKELVHRDWCGIVLSDVCMPECSGIELMTLFLAKDKHLPVVLITGHGDVPMAVEAVKMGAWDFLQKPINPEYLLEQVAKALAARKQRVLQRRWGKNQLMLNFVGSSEWSLQVRGQLQGLSETLAAVFLQGELGSGRTYLARYLHQISTPQQAPLVIKTLLNEQEVPVEAWVSEARSGTLVIKNIELLPVNQQRYLVQHLQQDQREFRLIGISDQPLLTLTKQQQIIAELYYYFSLTQVNCLPLSLRKADIPVLFQHYLELACTRLNQKLPELDESFIKKLSRRHWPGNVTELANAAELYAVGIMPMGETANPLLTSVAPTALDQQIENYERQIITEALNIHQGRINDVSEYLQMPRKKLYLRMKKYGLDKHHYRT